MGNVDLSCAQDIRYGHRKRRKALMTHDFPRTPKDIRDAGLRGSQIDAEQRHLSSHTCERAEQVRVAELRTELLSTRSVQAPAV